MKLIVFLLAILFLISSCEEDHIVNPCDTIVEECLIDLRRLWVTSSPPIQQDGTLINNYNNVAEHYWTAVIRDEHLPVFRMRARLRDLDPEISLKCSSDIRSILLNSIDPETSDWYGILRGFPGGLNISNARYLEIWVNDYNVDQISRSGTIYIDFGRIDEDYHRPDENEFDDENFSDWTVLDDTGFLGDDPGCIYPQYDFDSCYNPELLTCRCINSRIGNHYQDTEDLNRNGQLDQTNHFYRVGISLGDSAVIDVQRDYPYDEYESYWNECTDGDYYGEPFDCPFNKSNAWRLYKVDLSNLDHNVFPQNMGTPLREYVTHIRIWIPDADEINNQFGHLIHIAGLKFIE